MGEQRRKALLRRQWNQRSVAEEFRERSIARDLLWGIGCGVAFSIAALAFAALRWIVRGGPNLSGSVAEQALVVLACGLTGGVVVALLRPLSKRRWGSVCLGLVTAIAAYLPYMRYSQGPIATWDRTDVFALMLASLIVGGVLGWRWWPSGHYSDPAEQDREVARKVRQRSA